ncbi:uncharacterized protein [Antedon mediterranea]|uniref:uncharacterized protein n=1 Tax=Antedon mediterranea TaxID=105859 RepID=UPI003AF9A98E
MSINSRITNIESRLHLRRSTKSQFIKFIDITMDGCQLKGCILLLFTLYYYKCQGYELQPRVSYLRPEYCAADHTSKIHFEQTLQLRFDNVMPNTPLYTTICSIKLICLKEVSIGLTVTLNDGEFDENGNQVCDEGNYIQVADSLYNTLHTWCRNSDRYVYTNKSEVYMTLHLSRFSRVSSFIITAYEYKLDEPALDPSLLAMYIMMGVIAVFSFLLLCCICCCKRSPNQPHTTTTTTTNILTVIDPTGPSPHSPHPTDNYTPPSYSTAVNWSSEDDITEAPPSYDQVLASNGSAIGKSQHQGSKRGPTHLSIIIPPPSGNAESSPTRLETYSTVGLQTELPVN